MKVKSKHFVILEMMIMDHRYADIARELETVEERESLIMHAIEIISPMHESHWPNQVNWYLDNAISELNLT